MDNLQLTVQLSPSMLIISILLINVIYFIINSFIKENNKITVVIDIINVALMYSIVIITVLSAYSYSNLRMINVFILICFIIAYGCKWVCNRIAFKDLYMKYYKVYNMFRNISDGLVIVMLILILRKTFMIF